MISTRTIPVIAGPKGVAIQLDGFVAALLAMTGRKKP
jgi:hypothetical protein